MLIIRPEFIFQKPQNQRSNTTDHGTFLSCVHAAGVNKVGLVTVLTTMAEKK